MFTIFGGTEARRLPGRFQVPWKEIAFAVIILIAGSVVGSIALATDLFSDRSAPALTAPGMEQPVAQPVQPAVPAIQEPVARPVQPAPAAVMPAKEWPTVEDVVWRYTLTIDPVPYVDDPIYNGKMSQGSWWSPGSTPGDPVEMTRREIAKRVVPSITDRDLTGLSITRGRGNPSVILAAVWIQRDTQTQGELIARKEFTKADEHAKLQRHESHLGISVDNGETWRIIKLSYAPRPELEAIDNVLVTGTSPLLVTIRPFSSHGYWQTEVLP